MARTFSAPLQTYQPGVYGPYSVNQLTNANTDRLEVRMTIGPDWPKDPNQAVVRIDALWDTGGGASWTFNGDLKNQDQTPRTEILVWVQVPVEGDGAGGVQKGQVGGGNVRFEVFAPITTAVTLAGV